MSSNNMSTDLNSMEMHQQLQELLAQVKKEQELLEQREKKEQELLAQVKKEQELLEQQEKKEQELLAQVKKEQELLEQQKQEIAYWERQVLEREQAVEQTQKALQQELKSVKAEPGSADISNLTLQQPEVDYPIISPSYTLSTPFTYSSASQQGSEQTRVLVEARVFEELQYCTYRRLDGFFEKYFEGKTWTDRAGSIYDLVKDQHIEGKWINLSDTPPEGQIHSWLFQFQNRFLSGEGRQYCTISIPGQLTGGESRRQLDLVIKQKNQRIPDSIHHWKDVDVVGELKASNSSFKRRLMQVGRYVRDVFISQPTRRYVHAFTICGRDMEVWVFDRSGCYSSGSFDIHTNPRRFIQVLASYVMMTNEDLGLDIFTKKDGDSGFIEVDRIDGFGKRRLQLKLEPFTYQRAIVSRGTSCYYTKDPDSKDWDFVTKFSWNSHLRKSEVDLFTLAQRKGVQGIAQLIGYCEITDIAKIRSALLFTDDKKNRFRQQSQRQSPSSSRSNKRKQTNIGSKPSKRSRSTSKIQRAEQDATEDHMAEVQGISDAYQNRTFRCLVISPVGRALHMNKSIAELLGALRDAIKAHKSLYITGGILHRDISKNNIIITDPIKTGFTGMLIDLDLAKEVSSKEKTGARHRTGTMEFMAIEVLQDVDHTYRHDLESFFYVFIWQCARRSWGKNWKANTVLTKWYTGTFTDIIEAKRGAMHVDGFDSILMEFPPSFECLKPLCKQLRTILFPLTKEGRLFIGTPMDPEILYQPIIEAFDNVIESIQE